MADSEVVSLAPGTRGRLRAQEIRQYILDHLTADDFTEISRETAKRFGVSRKLVHKQLKRLEAKSIIEGRGNTKARVHRLVVEDSTKRVAVEGLEEDRLWDEFGSPRLRDLPENVLSICRYGFTEMVNNVIDHSGWLGYREPVVTQALNMDCNSLAQPALCLGYRPPGGNATGQIRHVSCIVGASFFNNNRVTHHNRLTSSIPPALGCC